MLKKFGAILVVLILIMSLAACGNEPVQQTVPEIQADPETYAEGDPEAYAEEEDPETPAAPAICATTVPGAMLANATVVMLNARIRTSNTVKMRDFLIDLILLLPSLIKYAALQVCLFPPSSC